MILARINGKYSNEASNLSKEEFAKAITQITTMLREEKGNNEDILLVTDLIESEVN